MGELPMNEYVGWIVGYFIVLCIWIGWNADELGTWPRASQEERRHTLRLLWLSPVWPVYTAILFIFKGIPWIVKELSEALPETGKRIRKGFADAWLPVKEEVDITDETKYERSEETNFEATPRLDIEFGRW
jgi:hypothetical protein